MMAYVSALAARAGESQFGRSWRKAADIVDCIVPIAIVSVLISFCAAIAFGFVN